MKTLLSWIAVAAVITFAVLADSIDAFAERRVALVVGNSAYTANSLSLTNPSNDAQDMTKALTDLGFEVVTATDATKRKMEIALQHFARLASNADSALFFYAGHALQYQGLNYLMPTDAQLEDDVSIKYDMVSLDYVREALDRTKGVRIMILDSCRNNPLVARLQRGATRSAALTRGLAPVDKTEGMVVAFATAADDVAQDGTGRNSPFTTALLRRLQEPGVEVGIMLRRVASDVNAQTNGRQRPETQISLLSEYYLNQNDHNAWEHIKDQDDEAALREFLMKYPISPLADAARRRLDQLEEARRIHEETERKIAEAEARLAEEQKRLLALKQRRQEDEQRRQEILRKQQDERKRQEALRQQTEEEKRQEIQRRQQEELKRQEALRRQEDEQRRQEVLRKQQEERKRQEALREQAEEEKRQEIQRRQQEELKRQEALRQQQQEEEKRLEALRKQQEEEKRLEPLRKQQEEEKRLEALRKQQEEEKRLEALRKQQEEEKRQEAMRKQQEEQRRQEALRKQQEEQRRQEALRQQEQKEEQRHQLAVRPQETQRPQEGQQTPPEPHQYSTSSLPPKEGLPPSNLLIQRVNLPEQIRDAQTELRRLGCFNGALGSRLNDTTRDAVRTFWQHTHKQVVEINITDDFIADLKRQRDPVCVAPIVPKTPVVDQSKEKERERAHTPPSRNADGGWGRPHSLSPGPSARGPTE